MRTISSSSLPSKGPLRPAVAKWRTLKYVMAFWKRRKKKKKKKKSKSSSNELRFCYCCRWRPKRQSNCCVVVSVRGGGRRERKNGGMLSMTTTSCLVTGRTGWPSACNKLFTASFFVQWITKVLHGRHTENYKLARFCGFFKSNKLQTLTHMHSRVQVEISEIGKLSVKSIFFCFTFTIFLLKVCVWLLCCAKNLLTSPTRGFFV